MTFFYLILCFFVTLVYGSTKAEGDEAIVAWLKDQAIPLKSEVFGSGSEDLTPVARIFRDVRIVGLGEATHGSREFSQFKHRMVEFLVQEMGFTVFAIEASYPECLNILIK